MRGQSPELEQLVLLQLARELHVVEVVEAVDRVAKGLVVLFLNKQVVVRLVDRLDVELGIEPSAK